MSTSTSRQFLLALRALMFSGLMTIASTICAQEWIPGEAWKRSEVGSRVQWTWGLTEGQSLINEELQPAQRTRLKNTIALQDAKLISEIMTDFYSDAANAHVPWKYMAVVAKMRLAGEQEGAIAERLRLLRQFASEQRKLAPR